MADDAHPDDDATRIYRPYGSPPPDGPPPSDEASEGTLDPPVAAPDPFAPDPPPVGPLAPADPFAPSPLPTTPNPFAPDPPAPDPFSPTAASPARDPFAPSEEAPSPFAPSSSAADPFSSSAAPPAGDPFAPVGESRAASDPFAPDVSLGADPFAPVPAASDPLAPSAPDPFRTPDGAEDPFAPPAPNPFPAPPPSASASPDPFTSPPTPAPPAPSVPADPFSMAPADPFAPAPPVPAPAPPPRAPDPFAAPPVTDSGDPFASLKGPVPAAAGAFDSGVRHDGYETAGSGVDLPDAFGAERTLAGAFTAVFSLILQIRAAERLGDATALRRRIEALLGEAARAARSVGASDADVDEATFAVVAFLDEAILGTEWPGRDAWSAQPLQLAHYDRYDAGEQVFDRLKRLLDEGGTRTAVLEVYYLCLALGFKGRYAIQGREVLRRLVDDLHGRLERANGAPGALSPRGRSREVPAQAEKSGVPTWALWVGAAVLVALLYIGLSVSLSGVASETADDLRSLSAAPE